MLRTIPILTCVLLVASAPALAAARPASDLTPVAAEHNKRGITLITAGEYEAAVDELLLAYSAMPDPIQSRAGRGKVMGSLRSALNQRHAETGDPQHLCRLQILLREHIEALVVALGDAARSDDVAGSVERLRQVDVALRGTACTTATATGPTVDAAPAPQVTPKLDLSPKPATPPAPMRIRIMRNHQARAGAALLGVGFVGVTTMAVGIIIHADYYNQLRSMTARLMQGGKPSPGDAEASALLLQGGRRMRALAIAGGVVGAVALATGIALRIKSRRNKRQARLVPDGGLDHFGVRAELSF